MGKIGRRGGKVKQPKTDLIEMKCSACDGKGFPPIKQPAPGRRIYPPPCKTCGGSGHVKKAAE